MRNLDENEILSTPVGEKINSKKGQGVAVSDLADRLMNSSSALNADDTDSPLEIPVPERPQNTPAAQVVTPAVRTNVKPSKPPQIAFYGTQEGIDLIKGMAKAQNMTQFNYIEMLCKRDVRVVQLANARGISPEEMFEIMLQAVH